MRAKRGAALGCLALLVLLVTTACGGNVRSVAVQGYQSHGSFLTIQYPDNPCAVKERRIEVEETDTQVQVTVSLVDTGNTCDAIAIPGHFEVPLNGPLAGRTVIDSTTGEPVLVYHHASNVDS